MTRLQLAIPVLHVENMQRSLEFYCDQLGFQPRFSYRIDESVPDPCYQGITRDDVWLHLSSFPGDGVAGGVVYLKVEQVDELFQSCQAAGMAIELEPTDQTWGNREMYLSDPDGNSLRFIQESS